MATTLAITGTILFTPSNSDAFSRGVTSLARTGTGDNFQITQQDVGTSTEAIALGDVAVGGWVLYRNLGPTNFVELYAATGETAFAKLAVGDICLMKSSAAATAPHAKADTAGIKLEVIRCSP